jgi:hypothetical protein
MITGIQARTTVVKKELAESMEYLIIVVESFVGVFSAVVG